MGAQTAFQEVFSGMAKERILGVLRNAAGLSRQRRRQRQRQQFRVEPWPQEKADRQALCRSVG